MADRDIDSLLDAELFERYVVKLDPMNRRLLLHDSETFVYSGKGEIVPLEVVDRRPVVEARVVAEAGKKSVPERLVIDTGSSRYLTLITKSRRQLKPPAERTLGASVGIVGDTLVVLAPVDRLEIGSLLMQKVETAWMEPFRLPAVRKIPKLNGIIGNPLLSRYHVFFDYRHGRLILERRSDFPDTAHEKLDGNRGFQRIADLPKHQNLACGLHRNLNRYILLGCETQCKGRKGGLRGKGSRIIREFPQSLSSFFQEEERNAIFRKSTHCSSRFRPGRRRDPRPGDNGFTAGACT